MKKLSLTDITLFAIAICLVLILLPVLIRLRQSTTAEKELQRVPGGATMTPLSMVVSETVDQQESLPVEDDAEEDIPRPANGKKPILIY